MKLLPISEENLNFIRLDLSRHYMQVDCDFTCYIVLNPSGIIPLGGTDVCLLHVGSWQIDTWSFLTDKFTKGTPGFSAFLCWDKTLVTEQYKAPRVAESDIDTANSISSLKGQPVNITGFSLPEGDGLPVKTYENQYVNTRYFDFDSGRYIPYLVRKKYLNIKIGTVLSDSDLEFLNNNEVSDGVFLFPNFSFAKKDVPSSGLIYLVFEKGNTELAWVESSWDPNGRICKGVFNDPKINISISDNVIQSITVTGFVNTVITIGSNIGHAGGVNIDFTFGDGEYLFISD